VQLDAHSPLHAQLHSAEPELDAAVEALEVVVVVELLVVEPLVVVEVVALEVTPDEPLALEVAPPVLVLEVTASTTTLPPQAAREATRTTGSDMPRMSGSVARARNRAHSDRPTG
jgi:hypothetical protein